MIIERFFRGRLIALFIVGMILFNYPIFSLFNRQLLVWGIPLPYLYIFLAWCLIILLVFLITVERRSSPILDREDSTD